jgi:phosphoserine aminotransferase
LLKKHGPLSTGSQGNESQEKASLIYDFLDSKPELFQVCPDKNVRSRMNLCFRIRDEATEKKFLEGAEKRGLLGLKGHRSVGGIRLSNYNAVSLEQVKKVRQWLEDFAQDA